LFGAAVLFGGLMTRSGNLPDRFDLLARNPRMLEVPEAATLLGIGRTLAYELVRTDQWPTPVVRIGRLVRIPSGPVLELLATGRT
jgi:predicted DNA-binding transcriptional regulator AlpA